MTRDNEQNEARDINSNGVDRRSFISKTLLAGAGVALAATQNQTTGQTRNSRARSNNQTSGSTTPGRRRLGKLEVSSIGMGVQNMHRNFQTTVPYRPEMIEILRAAYDRGITFFDCAEAYGPHENERILGEAIQSFREALDRSHTGDNQHGSHAAE